MIRITVVIPAPDLHESAAQALADCAAPDFVDCTVIHAHGSHVPSMNLDDADIIVARGLTLQAVARSHADRTVIRLPISAYDILRAIHDCRKRHGAERMVLVDSGSELDDVADLREMMSLDIRVFRVSGESGIREAIGQARACGADAVIGGLTACLMAAEAGFPTTPIPISHETLRNSIREAISTAGVMQGERAKAEISSAVLQSATDAILYFDAGARLSLCNRAARDMLRFDAPAPATGTAAAEILPDADLVSAVERCEERRGELKTIRGALLIADCVPVRVDSRVIGTLCSFRRANDIQATESKIRRELAHKGLVARYGFGDIIHSGQALSETIATAKKYAAVDSNVLLLGETGTGKELFAQSIHRASRRAGGPFVAVNCAAFAENLLESELFGYSEGAFTGASKKGKAGLFELAHGGTLFLDEVGEIPMSLQATLLRALQEGEIRRVGDDRVVPVDVRIIAATNVDLRRLAARGGFRRDLLYRLDILSLAIPPLRSRPEDIRHIASHYVKRYREAFGKPGLKFGAGAWSALEAYGWPGNTRELRNVCERLVVLGADGATISKETVRKTLSLSVDEGGGDGGEAGEAALPQVPAESVLQVLSALQMNRGDLAASLGMSRTTLWRKMKQNVPK